MKKKKKETIWTFGKVTFIGCLIWKELEVVK